VIWIEPVWNGFRGGLAQELAPLDYSAAFGWLFRKSACLHHNRDTARDELRLAQAGLGRIQHLYRSLDTDIWRVFPYNVKNLLNCWLVPPLIGARAVI